MDLENIDEGVLRDAKQIQNTLLKCKKAVVKIASSRGKDYNELLKPYINSLKRVMKTNNVNELAALSLIEGSPEFKNNGLIPLFYSVAALELLEKKAPVKR